MSSWRFFPGASKAASHGVYLDSGQTAPHIIAWQLGWQRARWMCSFANSLPYRMSLDIVPHLLSSFVSFSTSSFLIHVWCEFACMELSITTCSFSIVASRSCACQPCSNGTGPDCLSVCMLAADSMYINRALCPVWKCYVFVLWNTVCSPNTN